MARVHLSITCKQPIIYTRALGFSETLAGSLFLAPLLRSAIEALLEAEERDKSPSCSVDGRASACKQRI